MPAGNLFLLRKTGMEIWWAVALREVSVVVVLCDADDPDQTDELALIKAVCKERNCGLRTLFYHSQDWSTSHA